MTPNHVKQKLRAGTPSIGSWLNLGGPLSAETLAPLGFDWLCVDMEHGQIDHCTSTGAARRYHAKLRESGRSSSARWGRPASSCRPAK